MVINRTENRNKADFFEWRRWTASAVAQCALSSRDEPLGEARLRPEAGLRRAKVEPERIELSSREDNTVLSTCLVDFVLSGTTRQATA